MPARHLRPLLILAAALLSTGAAAEPVLMPVVSSDLNDYNFNTSADGRTAVFARSAAEFQGSKIHVMGRTADGGWTDPMPIGFSDPRWKDSDPWLTPDGTMLYFVSDRPTTTRPDKKDLDIWRSRRTADGWGAPEHLGDVVNGPGPELGPELHGGILTFNTVRKGGPGTLDIWSSALVDGAFQAPQPLPGPVNSPSQEGDFTISPDGSIALFWSLRDGKGRIYSATRTAEGWTDVRPLADAVNAADFQFTPQFSADGGTLTYASVKPRAGQAPGMADVYSVPAAAAVPALSKSGGSGEGRRRQVP